VVGWSFYLGNSPSSIKINADRLGPGSRMWKSGEIGTPARSMGQSRRGQFT